MLYLSAHFLTAERSPISLLSAMEITGRAQPYWVVHSRVDAGGLVVAGLTVFRWLGVCRSRSPRWKTVIPCLTRGVAPESRGVLRPADRHVTLRARKGAAMDFVSPPYTFVLVDGIVAPRLFGAIYRRFAASVELNGDEDVLEFGCGSGGIAERLAPRLPNGSLTCVDISPPMVRIATRRLKRYDNVRCLVGRISELALAENAFDCIVIHNALHDVTESERPETAEILALTLRPGGTLYLREPTDPSHGMPPDSYRALLTAAGLTEARSSEKRVFILGSVFDATFVKPG